MMPKPPRKPPATVTPARFEAFTILMELDRAANAHADDLLRGPRVTALPPQDRHLCTTLVLGVLRWQIRLDAAIRALLAKPNAKLDPAIRIALRLGLFQLHHLDRIPAHAAIGESVSLARLAGHQHASRMVNAVLRMLSEGPKPDLASLPANPAELAAAAAHPQWLVERWAANYGCAAAQAICQNGLRQPELALRLDNAAVEAELAGEGIHLAPGAILSAARRLLSGDVTATQAFRNGRVRIQDEGSQLIAELAGHGRRILDCCAAPGGKTLILAERNPQSPIAACELQPARLEALRTRIRNAGNPNLEAQISLLHADAAELLPPPQYDLILADVPCSGTGTLGRNPEIRHRLRPQDLARHAARQRAILRSALRVARPAGRLLYSTCSLEPEENAQVVAEVLADSPDARPASLRDRVIELGSQGRLTVPGREHLLSRIAQDGSLTLLPGEQTGCDGFFAALIEKMPEKIS